MARIASKLPSNYTLITREVLNKLLINSLALCISCEFVGNFLRCRLTYESDNVNQTGSLGWLAAILRRELIPHESSKP